MQKAYTNIIQIAGDVITVEAEGVGYLDIAQITTRRGVSLAQVIRIDSKKISLKNHWCKRASNCSIKPGLIYTKLDVLYRFQAAKTSIGEAAAELGEI